MKKLDIKAKILQEMGMSNANLHSKLPDSFRTHTMSLAEMKTGMPIEKLVFSDSCSNLASKLGFERTTISKWRTAIKIAMGKEWVAKNVPSKLK